MIEINNLTNIAVNKKFLKRIANIVLKKENKKNFGLSVALVSPERIRKLNKKYLKKNLVTDVLTFGQNQKFSIIPKSELGLGEIVICLYQVRRNAKRYGIPFKKELSQVLIHGILHLLGYGHEKSEIEAKRLKTKENYYLSRII